MKKTILPFVIMSIIAVFTTCGWYEPDTLYYSYNNSILLIKNSISIDTLHGSSSLDVLDFEEQPHSFTSDTFYYSKEYLLSLEHPDNWVMSAFVDSALSEHLRHLIFDNHKNEKYYAFYTRSEYEAIKASDCDSIAICYSGFYDCYKLNKKIN